MRHNNAYTFAFMGAVCIGCALIVSTAAVSLRSMQKENEKVDNYKNVLQVAGLTDPGASMSNAAVLALFDEKITIVGVGVDGEVVEEDPTKVPNLDTVIKQDKASPVDVDVYVKPEDRVYPVFLYQEEGAVSAYILPVYGQGLWGALLGYLAIEPDGKTIRGITFYKEKETPGLGKEITKPWFQEQFVGKTFLQGDGSIDFTVARPKPPLAEGDDEVNGISGATITGRGVQELIVKEMKTYRPYFEKNVWGNEAAVAALASPAGKPGA